MTSSGSVAQVPTQFEAFETFVRDLATTEGRLATSGIIVVLALLVGLVVVPLVVRATSRVLRSRLLPEGVVEILDVINTYLPTTVARTIARVVQVFVFLVAGLALLVTWGWAEIAFTVVSVLWVSLPFAGQIVLTVIVLVFAYIVVDIIDRAIREFGEEADRITDHQEEVMLRVGHVAVLLVVVSGLLTLWGLDLSGLLVGAGVLGIVLGLAARKTIGAMIAGFVLMFTQPFSVGDWVEISEHEGTVTSITVMHTELREFDGELVIIPNDVVSEKPIRNLSHQDTLRLRTEVGIDYNTSPEHAEQVALEAIETIDGITDTPPPEATATSFGDSAIVLEILYWIEEPTPSSRRHTRQAVIHAVKGHFDEAGITIPFPQRQLSERDEGGPNWTGVGESDDGSPTDDESV